MLVLTKDKLTDLCENSLLRYDFKNASCEISPDLLPCPSHHSHTRGFFLCIKSYEFSSAATRDCAVLVHTELRQDCVSEQVYLCLLMQWFHTATGGRKYSGGQWQG